MEDTRRLLPVVEFDGTRFFVDVESREFRDVDDPKNAVNMHADQGRRMVEEMAGMEWRVFQVDSEYRNRKQTCPLDCVQSLP